MECWYSWAFYSRPCAKYFYIYYIYTTWTTTRHIIWFKVKKNQAFEFLFPFCDYFPQKQEAKMEQKQLGFLTESLKTEMKNGFLLCKFWHFNNDFSPFRYNQNINQEVIVSQLYISSLGRKNPICAFGPWTCMQNKYLIKAHKNYFKTCSMASNTLKEFLLIKFWPWNMYETNFFQFFLDVS